jgi:N-acetylneuraminic acid mutarotase
MPRGHAAAATGTDGFIYVAGGTNSFSGFEDAMFSSAERYNPATDSWTPIADMPSARAQHGLASPGDGLIYAIGGAEGGPTGSRRQVIAYNPTFNVWLPRADLLEDRVGLATAVLDGKIYAIGGGGDPTTFAKASMERYDPSTNTWTPLAGMGLARRQFAAAASGGKIYVAGGLVAGPARTSAAEVYDPDTDSWSPIAPIPIFTSDHGLVTGIDGRLYVIGGVSTAPSQQTHVYDPGTNSWSSGPNLNEIRYGLTAASDANGVLYAISGWRIFDLKLSVEALQTVANQPPTADAGDDQTVSCVSGSAALTLDGSASSDPDASGIATYEWKEGATLLATGQSPTVSLGLGVHVITLRVIDPNGAFDEDEVVITVQDNSAPTLTLTQHATQLWPPNHQMVKAASFSASDGCSATTTLTIAVTSNEPVNGAGDGDTAPDWNVLTTASGTEVWVRSERKGSGSGRVYTITATATDGTGNSSTSTATVKVPKSQKP